MQAFDLQPTLIGNLISLRPIHPDDFASLYAAGSDPKIWEQHPEKTRYQLDAFQKFFDGAIDCGGGLIALDRKTGEVIGSSRYTDLDPEQRQVEIGYTFLATRCWGKGHNAEMKNLMLRHAFQYVERVVFFIGESNLRSRKAIEKIGAQFIKRIERQPPYVVYGIEKSDFKASL